MKFGSLFAGIGGFDLGLERAGMQCEWQVEIDPFCQRVLAKHWPNVERYSDIRDCGRHNLRQVDLLCGGFPCQDISNAGKRIGINGERSGLWGEFARIIRELRPRYVIVENVAAILVRGMDQVLGDLAASGYDAEWRVLRASDFGGIHERRRLFLVAYPHDSGRQRPKLLFQRRFSDSGSVRDGSRSQEWRTFRGSRSLETALQWYLRSPVICRVDDGIPARLERTIGLGNAIIPQIAEWIGQQIMETERAANEYR